MAATDSAMGLASGMSLKESRAVSEAQNWKLLQFFNYYRLAISAGAAGIGLFAGKLDPFGSTSPELFLATALLYLTVAAAAFFTIRAQRPDFETQVTLLGFADITLITMLMHASGGLASGLGLLLIVAVAGLSLMLGRRYAFFYAALATIAVLLEHSWGLLTGQAVSIGQVTEDSPQVGLLGIGLFATAFLGYALANRLRATEQLAARRGVDLANLAQINELVIQRMQTGVLVCDRDGHIRLINQAARRFLGMPAAAKKIPLSDVAPDLAIQFFQWLGNNSEARGWKIFTSRPGYTLLPRFVALGEASTPGILIFLEDMAVLKQQASQLKMSALARLTASIAHEIRNPLGAISNAAQLLGETVRPDSEERRLVKIIEEQGRRMNVIVQNVTQLARRDKVVPVKLELEPWIRDFIRQYAETAFVPREAFAVVGLAGLTACVDPDQLHQVVANLCQNALRASPPFTGTPLIKLQGGTDSERRPYLDVIDWGRGVPPEIVDHIFDPFFTTTPKGTGLGLYIARELCEGNGATLTHHPGEGGVGSRFRITFARLEDCAAFGSL